ncbi:MAG: bifunctional demethylmenaquinone methyltransferase/2-methoxy-6-polyprenyl-1,4-benzoquinol methylase UbiE [Rhodocyclaceae bacterium]
MNDIYLLRESARERAFAPIWSNDLKDVFADVAAYYDRANSFATLGLIDRLRDRFLATIEVEAGQRLLDVCAGTNVIGISLLRRQPGLEVYAADRSAAMQEVGQDLAGRHGLHINSTICDVHHLPFPDDHFDAVTLQYASRHLRVVRVFSEIHRVLKPGGRFYHCDMLRPAGRITEELYCLYLKVCLAVVSHAFGSGAAAMRCREYFVQAIRMFYSTEELSELLRHLGFTRIVGTSVLAGTVGFHRASKA